MKFATRNSRPAHQIFKLSDYFDAKEQKTKKSHFDKRLGKYVLKIWNSWNHMESTEQLIDLVDDLSHDEVSIFVWA